MTRKRRNLTDEEQTLWNQVAQKVKPLKVEKKRSVSPPVKAPPSPSYRKKPLFSLPPEELPPQNSSSSTKHIQRVRKVDIQARLDLHGFTREQARLQLGRFLARCQEHGYLWVLVITGKGRRKLESEGSHEDNPRGVLRDLVPQWLEEPALRPLVSAYVGAKLQDGGTGALYVRLKRLP